MVSSGALGRKVCISNVRLHRNNPAANINKNGARLTWRKDGIVSDDFVTESAYR
jgi:hypothetical protein